MKKRMSFSIKFITGLSLLIVGTRATAVTFSCAGPASHSGVDNIGLVSVGMPAIGPAPVKICSTNTAVNGVTAEVCKLWFSEILTARSTGATLIMHFDSAEPSIGGVTTCGGLGAWVLRVPYYVEYIP